MAINVTDVSRMPSPDPITDSMLYQVRFVFFAILYPIGELEAIVSNCINVIVFSKAGLKDSVSLSFFMLSLADFFYMLLVGAFGTFNAVSFFSDYTNKPAAAAVILLAIYQRLLLDCTILFTTYIAVVRCCCVVLPLKVKNIFTFKVTLCSYALMFCYAVATSVPVIASMSVVQELDPLTNATYPRVAFSKEFAKMFGIYELLNRVFLANTTLIIIVLCMAVLLFTLIRASKFRREFKGNTNSALQETDTNIDDAKSPTKQLNRKELQVVKVVFWVCLVYFISSINLILPRILQVTIPGFSFSGSFMNSYWLLFYLSFSITHFNSGVNIFIYYNYNTKYKETFLSLWCNATDNNRP